MTGFPIEQHWQQQRKTFSDLIDDCVVGYVIGGTSDVNLDVLESKSVIFAVDDITFRFVSVGITVVVYIVVFDNSVVVVAGELGEAVVAVAVVCLVHRGYKPMVVCCYSTVRDVWMQCGANPRGSFIHRAP